MFPQVPTDKLGKFQLTSNYNSFWPLMFRQTALNIQVELGEATKTAQKKQKREASGEGEDDYELIDLSSSTSGTTPRDTTLARFMSIAIDAHSPIA